MAERDDGRRPPDDRDPDAPDAPASAEEVAASQRLRDALAGAEKSRAGGALASDAASPEIELALSLKAAWAPALLTSDESRAVLDATPSAEELELAARLRDALAAGAPPSGATGSEAERAFAFAHALRAAFAPSALDPEEHRVILERALAKMDVAPRAATAGEVALLRRRATVVRVTFGVVAGGLALAASVLLVMTTAPLHGTEAPLAKARTTQPLFSEPFREGEASARIDRIASARASDYRDNRFTKWGVR